ncbi:MAG TPA: RagB/SusD family nutrient uptake outer membrane protein, partial [Flavisolibacter sp.]
MLVVSLVALLFIAGCTKKLDLVPTNDVTAETVYSTPEGYRQAIAKVYGAMALIGNGGATGSRDIPQEIYPDEGSSDFLRQLWNFQCVTTDEAVWTYTDRFDPVGLHQFNWTSDHPSVKALYYRSFFQITLANDFIRQASDENLSKRNISGTEVDNIRLFQAEARFLRAFQYWVLMDLFGNPPFVTENDAIGVGLPKQIQRKELFNYIESELKALESILPAPRANEYGRADRGAVWALLSRIYLNAEVYAGAAR